MNKNVSRVFELSLFKLIYFSLAATLVVFLATPFKPLSLIYGTQLILALALAKICNLSLSANSELPSLKLMTFTVLGCSAGFSTLCFFQVRVPIYPNSLVIYLNFLVFAPLAEELLFREGILASMLKCGVPKFISIFLSSLLFGLYHLVNLSQLDSYQNFIFLQVLFALVFGIFLGWKWVETKSLTLVVAIHCIVNATFLLFIEILY